MIEAFVGHNSLLRHIMCIYVYYMLMYLEVNPTYNYCKIMCLLWVVADRNFI